MKFRKVFERVGNAQAADWILDGGVGVLFGFTCSLASSIGAENAVAAGRAVSADDIYGYYSGLTVGSFSIAVVATGIYKHLQSKRSTKLESDGAVDLPKVSNGDTQPIPSFIEEVLETQSERPRMLSQQQLCFLRCPIALILDDLTAQQELIEHCNVGFIQTFVEDQDMCNSDLDAYMFAN